MYIEGSDRTQAPTRLLLVEDSEDDAELIELELVQAGLELHSHRVESAEGLREALSTQDWDIIISDFAMPRFDGLEAFKIVKSLGVDIPFIFVSGAIGEERAVEAMRAGARDYLLKGNLKRLAEAVRRELNEVASRRQRRKAEAAARREARRLAMAVEASGAGIFEHRVPAQADSYHSTRWAEILGFAPAELPPPEKVPAWFWDRIDAEDRQALLHAYDGFLAGRTAGLELETRVEHRDGSWVDVALFYKPIERDPAGAVTHVVGVMLDLTQRRRIEDQLRQSQKMEAIGRLAGGVAHDFNNLITVIYSFGGFVVGALEDGSEAMTDMQQVLEAAKRAASLTKQLLAFSRRQTIEPRVLNINDLVADIDRMLRRVLGEDIDFATKLSPALGNVRVDPSAFEQVLVNLAINARDAMPGGGKLTIETFNRDLGEAHVSRTKVEVPAGSYVVVAVSDDGCGMDPETLSQVFEPFFTTKEAGRGTGLGLSTCYGIVQQASGFIMVYSEPGQGTTFRVFLPRVVEAAEPAPAPPAPEKLEGTETILVAEDDAQVRMLAVRTLSQLGYRVLAADSGEQALRAHLGEQTIHLLLTDVVMHAMNGRQLAEQLTAARPTIRILYMSGYTTDAIVHRGVLEPQVTMLQKPFTPDELARSVRAVLDRP